MEALASTNRETEFDTSAVLAMLPSATECLEAFNKGSEPTFVQIGRQLETISNEAAMLEKEALATVDLVQSRLNSDLLKDVVNMTASCAGELRTWQPGIFEHLERLNSAAHLLGHLEPSSLKLRSIAGLLNTVNFYFAVESSRHDDCTRAFSLYIGQLNKLVKKILQITEDIQQRSTDAQMEQSHACASLQEVTTKLQHLVGAAEKSVMVTSAEADEIAKSTSCAMEQIACLSNNVSRQIGQIVMSLQFHDIVRQQVDHVIDALRKAENMMRGADAIDSNSDERMKHIEGAYSMLYIQAMQVRQSTLMVREAYQKMRDSFTGIGRHSNDLLSGIAVIDDNEHDGAELKGCLLRLCTALESLRGLMEDTHNIRSRTTDAAVTASKATSLLAERAEEVNDISTDIHIQALNALVTSRRLKDKGVTLMVLAKEVASLSKKCSEFVGLIVGDLRQINGMSTDMYDVELPCQPESSVRLMDIGEKINLAYLDYEQKATLMRERANHVQHMIVDTDDMLEFLPRMADQLEDCAWSIDNILNTLQAYLPDNYLEHHAVLDEHASTYTMVSERDIHNCLVNARKPSGRNQQEEISSAEVGVDVLGDNVELF